MSERIGTDTAEILPGSFGADIILGLGGNDRIDGNAGSDTLAGNAGLDTILGGSDNDFLFGGQDQDLLYGNEGNDTIFGNKGIDTLEGGSGDDVIFGGQGDDVILGGIGNDVIWGDLGADSLIGGSGADVFVLTRKSGGATLEEADVIADFVPGIDSIGLANSIETKSLNITFQSIANSSSNVNVIVQDLSTGQILAVVKNVRRSDFTSNDVFTTVLDPSSTVDPGEIPGSETDTDDQDPDLPPLEPVTRESVGKSAPLTTNTTIVTFQDSAYPFSLDDFSYFDIDGDPFSAVRITSLPGQGDLFLTSTTKDATTGASTVTRQPVTVDAEIAKASLSSLIFVPDPNTTGADYASFTFRVSDGANLSNVGTAAVIVKAKSSQPEGAAPTIDAANITEDAEEPVNGNPKLVQLFDDIDISYNGKLTKAVVSLSGGSPATGEDVLTVDLEKLDDLSAGITASLYDATNRTITLIGEASVQAYKTALELIQYTNTVNSVSKADRTVTVAIEDGLNPAVSASYTLKVAADDDAIEIKNADTSLLAAPESAAASASNPISLPIFVDTGVALTFIDPDTAGAGSTVISEIKVSVSNFDAADSLLFGTAALPTVYDGVKGELTGNTLTLTANPGSSPNAGDFATALQTIRFTNNSDTPNTSAREVSIKINGATLPPFRTINVQRTNDPPEITQSSVAGGDYTIPTVPSTGVATFNVSNLLTSANASDRDGDTISLGVTAINAGGTSGVWSYSNSNNGEDFTLIDLTGGTQAVSSGGRLRFSGATTVGSGSASLSFKASDGSALSSGTVGSGIATLSFAVKDSGEINSGPGADNGTSGIDAKLSGKVTIIYDDLADALNTNNPPGAAPDIINNFNPAQDVIRLEGSAFGAVTSSWDSDVVVSFSGDPSTAPVPTGISTADVIFFAATTDGAIDTFLNRSDVTLQPHAILVQRRTQNEKVRVWYVKDGGSPLKTQLADLGDLSGTSSTLVLSGTTASDRWNSFIANGAQAFEVVV
jgi:RTX calcium-binding nonapeptide repeat (4 copies)